MNTVINNIIKICYKINILLKKLKKNIKKCQKFMKNKKNIF